MLDGKGSVPSETGKFADTSSSTSQSETGEGLTECVSGAQDDTAHAEKQSAEDRDVAFACDKSACALTSEDANALHTEKVL